MKNYILDSEKETVVDAYFIFNRANAENSLIGI